MRWWSIHCAAAVALCACTSTPKLEAAPAIVASSVPPALRLAAADREVCAFDEQRALCISGPSRRGEPFLLRSGPSHTAEVAGACHRSTSGVVRCQGVEVGQDVASIAAAPYALRKDGSVLALDLDDDEGHVNTFEARRLVATSLGNVKKLAYALHAGCAIREDETVSCWTEPWTLSFASKQPAPKVRAVPGISGAVDLFLYSWLQLCVLDRAGTVRCSTPPPHPLDGCVPHGDGVRCGRIKQAPRPHALQGPTFDPADLLSRPLEQVTTAASSMMAFRWPAFEFLEEGGMVGLSEVDPGGCAVREGGVVCWNRSPCAGRKWSIVPVQGLPANARITLGAHRGYGLLPDGALYTFARRDVEPAQRGDEPRCDDEAAYAPPTIHATRMDLPPVHDVAGGIMREPQIPGYGAADCASLKDGTLLCWQSDAGKPLGPPLAVPLP